LVSQGRTIDLKDTAFIRSSDIGDLRSFDLNTILICSIECQRRPNTINPQLQSNPQHKQAAQKAAYPHILSVPAKNSVLLANIDLVVFRG